MTHRFVLEGVPAEGVVAAPDGRWQVTGPTGLLDLGDAWSSLAGRWIAFELRFARSENLPGAWLLAGGDQGEEEVAAFAPEPGRDHRVGIVRLPRRTQSLRVRVPAGAVFAAAQVRLHSLSRLEAAARLALPLLWRRLSEPRVIPSTLGKLFRTLRTGGIAAILEHLVRRNAKRLAYPEWWSRSGALSERDRGEIRAHSSKLSTRFSVLMPVYDTPEPWLTRAISSVRSQIYPHWELCIADDASRAPHVRRILEEAARQDARVRVAFREHNGHISAASNTALSLATGDYVVLLDHDDELAEDALACVAAVAGDADLIYSDEDKIDRSGALFDPFFKPDWNPDLLLSQDYIGHLCALRRSLVLEIGGFREGFEGSQDYDLLLRVSARTQRVRHLPFVLYHWRSIEGSTARDPSSKAYAETAALRALQEQVGGAARVERGPLPTTYRVRWRVPEPAPLVSLIVPTRDARALLETCIESLLSKTRYQPFELLIVDNQSASAEALEYLGSLQRRGAARVLRYDAPFNFAAINNFAARHARGTVLGLLNNDLEVLDGDWLEEMVSQAMRPGIGAVGARLLYPDRTVQHGGVVLGIGGIAGHAFKYSPADAPGYFSRAQLVHDVSAVTAACLLIRKETFDRVSGLDETLTVAFNDVDFCLRVRELGLRNLWTPFATLVHHESKSRGSDEDTRAKRSRFRVERRRMIERWGKALREDPAYSPNLTLESEDFSLAWPPRARKPWK